MGISRCYGISLGMVVGLMSVPSAALQLAHRMPSSNPGHVIIQVLAGVPYSVDCRVTWQSYSKSGMRFSGGPAVLVDVAGDRWSEVLGPLLMGDLAVRFDGLQAYCEKSFAQQQREAAEARLAALQQRQREQQEQQRQQALARQQASETAQQQALARQAEQTRQRELERQQQAQQWEAQERARAEEQQRAEQSARDRMAQQSREAERARQAQLRQQEIQAQQVREKAQAEQARRDAINKQRQALAGQLGDMLLQMNDTQHGQQEAAAQQRHQQQMHALTQGIDQLQGAMGADKVAPVSASSGNCRDRRAYRVMLYDLPPGSGYRWLSEPLPHLIGLAGDVTSLQENLRFVASQEENTYSGADQALATQANRQAMQALKGCR